MQVMLLAAGRGTSLDELGRQIETLAREGAELVVLNAHNPSEQIVEFVEGREHPCRVEVVVEPELLGNAGGLRGALSHFERHMPVAVLDSDTLVDVPLHRIVDEHIQSGDAGTICATWQQDTAGKAVLMVDMAGNVLGIDHKPSGLVSAGVYVLDRELAALIPPGVFFDLERDLFPMVQDLELGLRVEQLVGSMAAPAPHWLYAAPRDAAAAE
jgi:NDP-sugar pyrophosphorylase family protein